MHNNGYGYIGNSPSSGGGSFYFDIASGEFSDKTVVHKFGANEDIDNSSEPEDIWSGGGLYPFQSSDDTLNIYSSSANDTSEGTGAKEIVVEGLDINYAEVSEKFTMNGIGIVTGSTRFIRVNRAFVVAAGSGEVNAGTITIETTVGRVTIATIPQDKGQTQMAIYTVPANKYAYLIDWFGAVVKSNNTEATLEFCERTFSGVRKAKSSMGIGVGGSSSFQKEYYVPKRIDEKTDLYVRCPDVTQNNTQMFSSFTLILVDN